MRDSNHWLSKLWDQDLHADLTGFSFQLFSQSGTAKMGQVCQVASDHIRSLRLALHWIYDGHQSPIITCLASSHIVAKCYRSKPLPLRTRRMSVDTSCPWLVQWLTKSVQPVALLSWEPSSASIVQQIDADLHNRSMADPGTATSNATWPLEGPPNAAAANWRPRGSAWGLWELPSQWFLTSM